MTLLDMRAAAVALAQRGFRVFKLAEGGKQALTAGWPATATAWPDAVHKMWSDPTGDPLHHNIGVLADGLLILDPDVKRREAGVDGLASLADMVDTFGLDTNTFTVSTPTGGRHLYYRLPEGQQVRNSVDRIAPGIDVRGYHGYVVGPGSVVDGVAYTIINDAPLLEAPEWLVKAAGKPRERTAGAGEGVSELDAPNDVRRAMIYLKEEAPVSVHGRARDTLYRVAARVKDFGISEQENQSLIVEHYLDSPRCEIPWEIDAVAETVANAYRYGKEVVGAASLAADFSAVDMPEGSAPGAQPRPRLHFVSFADSMAMATKEQAPALIDGLLDCHAMSVMYGASNVGKTFVALDLAFHVASGRPWRGKAVAQGVVVYVAAEAGRGIHRRVAALGRHYGVGDVPLAVVPCPVDLLDARGDTEALVALVQEAGVALGGPVVMIVVDTLSRALAGGDENSSVDMGAFVKHADRLRAAAGAHVMVVHHSGKDVSKGARGHSLLRAATDTEIEIAGGEIQATKQREMEMGAPMAFRLHEVIVGKTPEGKIVTSCVAVERYDMPAEAVMADLPAEEREWHEVIMEALIDEAERTGTKINSISFDGSFVRSAVAGEGFTAGNRRPGKPPSKVTIWRRMAALVSRGLYMKSKRNQWVARSFQEGETS